MSQRFLSNFGKNVDQAGFRTRNSWIAKAAKPKETQYVVIYAMRKNTGITAYSNFSFQVIDILKGINENTLKIVEMAALPGVQGCGI